VGGVNKDYVQFH